QGLHALCNELSYKFSQIMQPMSPPGSEDLPIIGSPLSTPLHELLLRAQAVHRSLVGVAASSERRHPRDDSLASAAVTNTGASSIGSAVWTIAGLMSAQLRKDSSGGGGGGGSCCCCCSPRDGLGKLAAASPDGLLEAAGSKKMVALTLTMAEERRLFAASLGSQLVTLGIGFSKDLLHNELKWTDDKPECVLARFELNVERQLVNSYLTAGLRVIWTKYDSKNCTLLFTLDQRSQGSNDQQNDELNKAVDYLIKVARKGYFWIEYPESNLNFCPPQEAAIWTSKRMAVEAEFSSDDTA
ncbi:hypothetical protein BOX15_Mlig021264g2, partial [Macrostomum lignano]